MAMMRSPLAHAWTCRCGAFHCQFTFNGNPAEFPISVCAPCCGDELNLNVGLTEELLPSALRVPAGRRLRSV